MSHEENVIKQLEALIKLGPWLKAIIIGAFGIGLWVASLQIQVKNISEDLSALEVSARSQEEKFNLWQDTIVRETVEVKVEVKAVREDIQEMKQALDRLSR